MNKKHHTLSSRDRDFFHLVSEAVSSNPFSRERYELDLRLAEVSAPIARPGLLQRVIGRVTQRLRSLEADEPLDICCYGREDREVLETAILFDLFHRYIDDFDGLIQQQIKAGEEACCEVLFADQAIAELLRWGYSLQDACRFFAVCFQLRRAFYFIRENLVGRAPCMKDLQRRLWENVFTHDLRLYERILWDRMEDFSTLLLGETGTGKGAAGAAIGRSGYIPFDHRRKCFADSFTRTFVSINLSQYPEALIESELFGHRKGAFTGAMEQHEGIFSRCRPMGAIFLDEIGEVSEPVQIKLLQVLQERVYTPVGSHASQRFEGRVIAATNQPLEKLRSEGFFRDDFYYRLCSDVIVLPALRQRLMEDAGEMDILLENIVKRLLGEADPEVAGRVRAALAQSPGSDYPWPGNVRELEQAARRILLKGAYEGDTMHGGQGGISQRLIQGIQHAGVSAEEMLSLYARMLYDRTGSYGETGRVMEVDWRTAKKYVELQQGLEPTQ